MRRAILLSTAAVVGVLALAEFVHWKASWGEIGDAASPPTSEAVIVLGFRNRGARANFVNRYRVRAALRSMDPAAPRSLLVVCGGAVGGDIPESELMARYARRRGYGGSIRRESASTTTWENIRNVVPLIEHMDAIKIVSDSLHAEKARAYLRAMRPDLAARLRRGEDYRLGELVFVKPFAAVIGLRARRWFRARGVEPVSSDHAHV